MKNKKVLFIAQTAGIAAMYAALTYAQNLLLAGGAIKPFVSRYAGTVSIVMAIALLVCAVMMLFI